MNTIVDRSTVPLDDCNFSLLPLHFVVDPAVDDMTSYQRQMSLSQQVDLMANYLDIQRVPVTAGSDIERPANQLDVPGAGLRPRTSSWGGRDNSQTTSRTAGAVQATTAVILLLFSDNAPNNRIIS